VSGGIVTLQGSGWNPAVSIGVQFVQGEIRLPLDTFTPDASGSFSRDERIPTVAPGRYALFVQDEIAVLLPFEVTPPLGSAPAGSNATPLAAVATPVATPVAAQPSFTG
jgi:hypothetical protein